jgi:hypothetical protein
MVDRDTQIEMPAEAEKVALSPVLIREGYLEVSPIADDGGELVGRKPEEISLAMLKALGGPESPIRAIRAKCMDCSGENAAEVRKCVAVRCALWPFRMGKNPFWGKSEEVV